jgi:hypothetical protein
MSKEFYTHENLIDHLERLTYVLESDVAVEIDHRRDDVLARQVDVHSPGRNLQLASPADPGEQVVLDNECGVFDWRAAVARDEPSPFEYRHAGPPGLAVYPPGPGQVLAMAPRKPGCG